MKNEFTVREIQLEEKKILDSVVKFLDENNLKYSLAGGTFLGAVRHKGFIPWDDDIDIFLPRPDYDRLQKLLKKGSVLDDHLYFHSLELKNLNMPFTKVYNHDIFINDWRYNDKYEKYLWIDIFPLDGLPEDDTECEKIYRKKKFYNKFLMHRKTSNKAIFNDKRIIKNLIKLLIKWILLLIPESFWAKRIVKLTKKNDYAKSKYVGNIVWGLGPKERTLKAETEDLTKIEFEGDLYNSFSDYDKYLTSIYGDYMSLPPVEKRVTHNFVAWRNKNEKN